jgi:hypothetical protein
MTAVPFEIIQAVAQQPEELVPERDELDFATNKVTPAFSGHRPTRRVRAGGVMMRIDHSRDFEH